MYINYWQFLATQLPTNLFSTVSRFSCWREEFLSSLWFFGTVIRYLVPSNTEDAVLILLFIFIVPASFMYIVYTYFFRLAFASLNLLCWTWYIVFFGECFKLLLRCRSLLTNRARRITPKQSTTCWGRDRTGFSNSSWVGQSGYSATESREERCLDGLTGAWAEGLALPESERIDPDVKHGQHIRRMPSRLWQSLRFRIMMFSIIIWACNCLPSDLVIWIWRNISKISPKRINWHMPKPQKHVVKSNSIYSCRGILYQSNPTC